MKKWAGRVFEGLVVEFITKLISILFPNDITNLIVLGIGSLVTGFFVFREPTKSDFNDYPKAVNVFTQSPQTRRTPDTNNEFVKRSWSSIGAFYDIYIAGFLGIYLLPPISSGVSMWLAWLFLTSLFISLALGVWKKIMVAQALSLIFSCFSMIIVTVSITSGSPNISTFFTLIFTVIAAISIFISSFFEGNPNEK